MANVCEPKIIKSLKETQEKIEKVCEIGDKLYLRFDIKVRVEELILKYCDLNSLKLSI